MDFEFKISNKLALEILNKSFGNMLKFIEFEDDTISIGIHIMLSVIKIDVKILKIEPGYGIWIEFVGNGVKSFMVKKVIAAFYEKAHLTKTDRENVYIYSWRDHMEKLGKYRYLIENAKSVAINARNGELCVKADVV